MLAQLLLTAIVGLSCTDYEKIGIPIPKMYQHLERKTYYCHIYPDNKQDIIGAMLGFKARKAGDLVELDHLQLFCVYSCSYIDKNKNRCFALFTIDHDWIEVENGHSRITRIKKLMIFKSNGTTIEENNE